MDNYTIKRNSKPLTDEEISKHKDFNALLANQQKLHRYKDATKPLYKNFGFLSLMVLIGVVLLVLVLETDKKDSTQEPVATSSETNNDSENSATSLNQETPSNQKESSNAPKTNVTKQKESSILPYSYETFAIDPSLGGVVYTKNGTRILVEPHSFSKAVEASNSINIAFRILEEEEMKKYVVGNNQEAFTAFEVWFSAIDAAQRIEPVKAVRVELAGPIVSEKNNLYKVNSKNVLEFQSKEESSYRFLIQANDQNFPELLVFKNLLWEIKSVSGNSDEFNYIFSRSWKNIEISGATNNSSVALKNPSTSFKSSLALVALDSKEKATFLETAIFKVYELGKTGKTTSEEYKSAIQQIEDWKQSENGKVYAKWATEQNAGNQLRSISKTSNFTIPTSGIYFGLASKGIKKDVPISTRKIIVEKAPIKAQHYLNQQHNEEPSGKE